MKAKYIFGMLLLLNLCPLRPQKLLRYLIICATCHLNSFPCSLIGFYLRFLLGSHTCAEAQQETVWASDATEGLEDEDVYG